MARCLAVRRAIPWPWIRVNATFSHTLRLSKSAFCWNSTPTPRIRCSSSLLSRLARSVSPKRTLPPSIGIRPSRHFSKTDLPPDDEPTSTVDCPSGTSRSTPRSTGLPSNALTTPRAVTVMLMGRL